MVFAKRAPDHIPSPCPTGEDRRPSVLIAQALHPLLHAQGCSVPSSSHCGWVLIRGPVPHRHQQCQAPWLHAFSPQDLL